MKTVSIFFSTLFCLALLTSCQKEDIIPTQTNADGQISTQPNPGTGKPDGSGSYTSVDGNTQDNWMLCDQNWQITMVTSSSGSSLQMSDMNGNVKMRANEVDPDNLPQEVREGIKETYGDPSNVARAWNSYYPASSHYLIEFGSVGVVGTDASQDSNLIALYYEDGTLLCKGTK